MKASIYQANETMRIVGKQYAICADTKEGKAIKDILDAMGLPLTETNVMLCMHGMQYGLYEGRIQAKNCIVS